MTDLRQQCELLGWLDKLARPVLADTGSWAGLLELPAEAGMKTSGGPDQTKASKTVSGFGLAKVSVSRSPLWLDFSKTGL